MGKLSTSHRNHLKSSQFGLPAQRKYPIYDRSHAQNAKARASQAEKAGHITQAQQAQIDAKANKVLKGK